MDPPVTPRDLLVEPFNSLLSTWSNWITRLERAFDLFHIPTSKRPDFLLHFLGREEKSLIARTTNSNVNLLGYEQLLQICNDVYASHEDTDTKKTFDFMTRHQLPNESMSQYLQCLWNMTNGCNFGGYAGIAVKNQLILGMLNKTLQQKLLQMRDLTLKQIMDICDSDESNTIEPAAKIIRIVDSNGFELKGPMPVGTDPWSQPGLHHLPGPSGCHRRPHHLRHHRDDRAAEQAQGLPRGQAGEQRCVYFMPQTPPTAVKEEEEKIQVKEEEEKFQE